MGNLFVQNTFLDSCVPGIVPFTEGWYGHTRRYTAFLSISSRLMIIDSHHHLWKYSASEYGWISDEMGVLRNEFLAPALREVAEKAGVDGFVSVQARQSITETDALLQLAEQEPLVRGVVGWFPLASPTIAETLDRYANKEKLKGVRHVVQDEPDDRFLLNQEFNRGVELLKDRNLVYDILIYARQLPAAVAFVDRHPDQSFVVDHIAKPTIVKGKFDAQWEMNLRELARRRNVTCKFSGVATEIRDAQWDVETIRPYFETALDSFSSKRLMFGSDWPVCLLKTPYKRWLSVACELVKPLSLTEQNDFFSNNAIHQYQL